MYETNPKSATIAKFFFAKQNFVIFVKIVKYITLL